MSKALATHKCHSTQRRTSGPCWGKSRDQLGTATKCNQKWFIEKYYTQFANYVLLQLNSSKIRALFFFFALLRGVFRRVNRSPCPSPAGSVAAAGWAPTEQRVRVCLSHVMDRPLGPDSTAPAPPMPVRYPGMVIDWWSPIVYQSFLSEPFPSLSLRSTWSFDWLTDRLRPSGVGLAGWGWSRS